MNQLLFWGVPWVDIIWYYLQMGHESAVRIQWKYWSRWCVPSKHGEGTVDGEWLAAIRACLKIGDIRKLPPTKKRQMRSKTNVNHGSWWGWQFCSSYHLPALRFWTIWAKTLEFRIRKHVSSDLSHVKISTIIISITSLTTHTYVCISLHILIYGAWSANELFLRFFFPPGIIPSITSFCCSNHFESPNIPRSCWQSSSHTEVPFRLAKSPMVVDL